jgi:hypothetical protein
MMYKTVDVVGTWETVDSNETRSEVYDFRADGTLTRTTTTQGFFGIKMPGMPPQPPIINSRTHTYHIERGNPPVLVTEGLIPHHQEVVRNGDEMTLTDVFPFRGNVVRLKKKK